MLGTSPLRPRCKQLSFRRIFQLPQHRTSITLPARAIHTPLQPPPPVSYCEQSSRYQKNMATYSPPKLKRMMREELSTLLLTTSPNDETVVVVVDVRDHDHVGGHIKLSRHVPSSTLDYATPDLVRQLRHAPKVVFHCALSQQRGPSAALKYLQERERMYPSSPTNAALKRGEAETPAEEKCLGESRGSEVGDKIRDLKQEVYVLDGGFVKWQEKYGHDDRLTENYDAELWAMGY